MKERSLQIIVAVLVVLLVGGVAAYAATSYGTRDDPLITKSYLDEVEIFGGHVDLEDLAARAGTISYELLCAVSPRVPRVVV